MDIVKPSTIAGVMELLPEDQLVFNKFKSIIEETFLENQFLPIETPLIEKDEILLAKGGGETEKQIYSIAGSSKKMSLRFDLTVPLARYVSEHFSDLNFPFKRYQIGRVYRGERNQKGRYREFYQCDIDIIGNGKLSIYNDALAPKVIYQVFENLDFPEVTFHINNRKLLNGFFESLGLEDSVEILRTIDKRGKIGDEKTLALLEEEVEDLSEKILAFISQEGENEEILEALSNFEGSVTYQEGLLELKQVYQYMVAFGIPNSAIKIDLSITRGLDYYTGTVYETFLNGYEDLGSVCSGGRYENLASNFSKNTLPGVGLSIGLTRLFYQVKDLGLLDKYRKPFTDILVLPMGEDYNLYGIEVEEKFKEAGLKADIYLESGKVKKKFAYADKLAVKYCIIVGEEEAKAGKVSLRDMETGDQDLMDLDLAIEKIKNK